MTQLMLTDVKLAPLSISMSKKYSTCSKKCACVAYRWMAVQSGRGVDVSQLRARPSGVIKTHTHIRFCSDPELFADLSSEILLFASTL